jgi:hypothetical protein
MATAAGATGQAHVIAAEIQRFLLFYAGVFTLITLTAAVGAGLAATDRVFLSPGRRVLAQAFHRSVSLVALSALATHIMLEVITQRATAADSVVPFLAGRANFYMGVGTLACDLFVLIIVTGMLRRRFATTSHPWVWRALHGTAYLCWPLAVLHGLLAGRLAKPYVDWSYGACLAAAGLALTMRFMATVRGRDTAAQPVPDRPAAALYAAPAMLDRISGWPAPPAGPALGAPASGGTALGSSASGSSTGAGLAGPGRQPPRALPPGAPHPPAQRWDTQAWRLPPRPAQSRETQVRDTGPPEKIPPERHTDAQRWDTGPWAAQPRAAQPRYGPQAGAFPPEAGPPDVPGQPPLTGEWPTWPQAADWTPPGEWPPGETQLTSETWPPGETWSPDHDWPQPGTQGSGTWR